VATPFAPYYGIQMLSKLGMAGDTMVGSGSGSPLVKVHAVRKAGGGLNVMIANEDPSNSYTANLTLNGFTPSGSATVYTLGNNAKAITSSTGGSATSVTVAPYTLTVLQIPGSGGTIATVPGAPGPPVASNLSSSTSSNTSGTATLTWAAAKAGTYPVASYRVYQVTSSGSTLVTTQTGTTLNLSGLTIGTSYSYYVVAVDTQGNTSQASSSGTFTIPPPANASCAVHYAISNSWPGGFGASITLTNRATTPLASWTITFTWPAAGESVQSGWNGTWSQNGQQVTIANASWNGTVAANGGTVSVGFNGTDTGQFPAPAAFFLNGNVCSNN
jgi:Cellulose binding domain/Fibronectin type III domain